MRHLARLAVLLLPLLAGGCSALSLLGGGSDPLEIYELQTPAIRTAVSRRGVEVVVEEPVASGALAVERIMISPSPLQAQYLPGVRWSDTAPVMVQTLLVRSLTETGALGSVGRRPVGSTADYAVLGELTDFQAEVAGEGAVVRVRLILRLVREADARVVATRIFVAEQPAGSTGVETVVPAFDLAMSRVLGEAVPWVLAAAR